MTQGEAGKHLRREIMTWFVNVVVKIINIVK